MKYSFIEKLDGEQEISSLASSQLASLSQVWREKKAEIEKSAHFADFKEKLHREWAIETGLVERLYQWDRGITEILMDKGIDAALISHPNGADRESSAEIVRLIEDQKSIIDNLFGYVEGSYPLSEHYIRGLHQQFTRHQKFVEVRTLDGRIARQEMLRGDYKKWPNNPQVNKDGDIHEYCPPEQVAGEMQKLLQWHQEYAGQSGFPTEVWAAWLHHRFVQIHPFQDGNGRVARTLASLVFIKAELFPLIIRNDHRDRYIDALEEADRGDLAPLVAMFAEQQCAAILSALSQIEQVGREADYRQIVDRSINLLKAKFEKREKDAGESNRIASRLQEHICQRLEHAANDINENLQILKSGPQEHHNFMAQSRCSTEDESHYYYREVVAVAKQRNYFANTENYHSWAQLSIQTSKRFYMVFSVHGYGPQERGLRVVSPFTFEVAQVFDAEGNEHRERTDAARCHEELFHFNYRDDEEEVIRRLDIWLSEAINLGLLAWNRTL